MSAVVLSARDAVARALLKLGDVDETVVEYLSSAIEEASDASQMKETVETLLPQFLVSYGIFEDEDSPEMLSACKTVVESLAEAGICGKAEDGAATNQTSKSSGSRRRGGGRRRRRQVPKPSKDDEDEWGLKSLKNQNKANVVVETILTKKEIRKNAKKEERAKKREDAENRRFEEERKAAALTAGTIVQSEAQVDPSGANSSGDVLVHNFSLSVGTGKELLSNATVKLARGRRYGLIGKNGVGKSTLLKAIARRELPGFPSNLSIVHVEQEVVGDDVTVLERVLSMDKKRTKLVKREKEIMDLLEKSEDESLTDELTEVCRALAAIGADDAESRARRILSGLSFSAHMQEVATKSLSGGWRMRVALACALFIDPDILMLDEPTNHLDLEACVWLEVYLQKCKNTQIVVSHDRNFTNNVVTDVIHFCNRELIYYKGDIDTFEKVRAQRRLNDQRAFESQEARRKHMQKFVDKFRFNAKRASLVQSRIKAINRLPALSEVIDDPLFRFEFPEPVSVLGPPILQVLGVDFKYPKSASEELLLKNVDFGVDMNSRIVILGCNGSGKSTLMKLICGELEALGGYVQRNPKLRIAKFTQHHVEALGEHARKTPLEYMLHIFPQEKVETMRPQLARYGIPAELAEQEIRTLSGGQKSRVSFAAITFTRPHILALDEPTNHLDLETVEALSLACSQFNGGIILISHDQHFVSTCGEEFWVVKDRKVVQFKGTFDEYKRKMAKEMKL